MGFMLRSRINLVLCVLNIVETLTSVIVNDCRRLKWGRSFHECFTRYICISALIVLWNDDLSLNVVEGIVSVQTMLYLVILKMMTMLIMMMNNFVVYSTKIESLLYLHTENP